MNDADIDRAIELGHSIIREGRERQSEAEFYDAMNLSTKDNPAGWEPMADAVVGHLVATQVTTVRYRNLCTRMAKENLRPGSAMEKEADQAHHKHVIAHGSHQMSAGIVNQVLDMAARQRSEGSEPSRAEQWVRQVLQWTAELYSTAALDPDTEPGRSQATDAKSAA